MRFFLEKLTEFLIEIDFLSKFFSKCTKISKLGLDILSRVLADILTLM